MIKHTHNKYNKKNTKNTQQKTTKQRNNHNESYITVSTLINTYTHQHKTKHTPKQHTYTKHTQ